MASLSSPDPTVCLQSWLEGWAVGTMLSTFLTPSCRSTTTLYPGVRIHFSEEDTEGLASS